MAEVIRHSADAVFAGRQSARVRLLRRVNRYLNQPLQKRLIRLMRVQPQGLPGLVCSEELTRIVLA